MRLKKNIRSAVLFTVLVNTLWLWSSCELEETPVDIQWDVNTPRTLEYLYTRRYDLESPSPKTETSEIILEFMGNGEVGVSVDGSPKGTFTMKTSGSLTSIGDESPSPVELDGLAIFPDFLEYFFVRSGDTWVRLDPSESEASESEARLIVQAKREYEVVSSDLTVEIRIIGHLRILDTPDARAALEDLLGDDATDFLADQATYLTGQISINPMRHVVDRYESISTILFMAPGMTPDPIATAPDRHEVSLELQN